MKSILKVVIFSFIMMSCSEEGTGSENSNYADLIDQAWISFTAKDYTGAKTLFNEAKSLDESRYEAFLGLAWSQLKLAEQSDALSQFNMGISKNDTVADLYAGKAFTLALGEASNSDLNASNTAINSTLSLDANWQFGNGLALSKTDLLATKAQNFYRLGDYASSLAAVQEIDSNFSADIQSSSGIDALAAKIESYNPGI